VAELDEGCVGVNFLDKLQAHKGGLIRLKKELYWHDRGDLDGVEERHCILLDAPVKTTPAIEDAVTPTVELYNANELKKTAVILLLVDGKPQWIWVAEKDLELISTK
jgi:hypothetical protein